MARSSECNATNAIHTNRIGDFCLVDLGDPSQDRSTKSPERKREQKKRWFLVPPVLGAQGDFCLVDLGDPSQDRSTKSPERKREQKKRWFLVPRPTANLPTVLGAQGDFCLVDQIRANPTKALLPPVDFLPWRHAKPGCELASASNEVEESVSRR